MIDPSYIRNIRDGLKSENIEANNLEALPEGLVGLYDKELFPPTMKWKERKEILDFFLVFALVQKEISTDFASAILGEKWFKVLANENETTEEKRLKKVNEFIQLHSKRFTSVGEGKFRLYHERFRVYILQKVSEGDLAQFNQLFISLCESELKKNTDKDIPEKERYALEFLSTHFFISAMQGEKVCLNKKDADSLKNLAYDQQYWERQIKASKGFEWSKKMLNKMMSWASMFDEEEVIECALNKVDLYHQEQNDAPRIVQLVADGDIEIALNRIEKFGGEDKEGLKRKFILYMLCLIELTLLESKSKSYRIEAIKEILQQLDKNIPSDQPKFFDWNDFFSSYLVFKLACEWELLGVNYTCLLFKTTNWNLDWISEKTLSIEQFNVLLKITLSLKEDENRRRITREIIASIANGGETEKALEIAEKLSHDDLVIVKAITSFINAELDKGITYCSAIKDIQTRAVFVKERVLIFLSAQNTLAAIQLARSLPKCKIKSSILLNISLLLFSEEQKETAEIILKESYEAKEEEDEFIYRDYKSTKENKFEQIKDFNSVNRINYSREINLILEMVEFNNFNYALLSAEKLIDTYLSYYAKCKIAEKMSNSNYQEQAYQIYLQVIEKLDTHLTYPELHFICKCCIEGLICLGKIEEGILLMQKYSLYQLNYLFVHYLTDDIQSCFNQLLSELKTKIEVDFKQKNKLNAEFSSILFRKGYFEKSNEIANKITDQVIRSKTLESIAEELLNKNKFDELIELVQNSLTKEDVTKWVLFIVDKLLENKEVERAISYLNKTKSKQTKSLILEKISIEFAKQRKLEESFSCIEKITSHEVKQTVLASIAFEVLKHDEFEQAIKISNSISNTLIRDKSFYSMALYLIEKDLVTNATKLIQYIDDDQIKYSILSSLASKYLMMSKYEDAIETVKRIYNTTKKDNINREIAFYLLENEMLLESINVINDIVDIEFNIKTSIMIATKINKKGNNDLAIKTLLNAEKTVRKISQVENKIISLTELSISFKKVGLEQKGKILLEEALLLTENISDIPNFRFSYYYDSAEKSNLLKEISFLLINSGDYNGAYEIMNTIKNESVKTSTIEKMCSILISRNEINNVWHLIDLLSTKSKKREVLKQMLSDTNILNDFKLWESLFSHNAWEEYKMDAFKVATKIIILNRSLEDSLRLITELSDLDNRRNIYNCFTFELSIEDMEINNVKMLLKSSYLTIKSIKHILKSYFFNHFVNSGLSNQASNLYPEKYFQMLSIENY